MITQTRTLSVEHLSEISECRVQAGNMPAPASNMLAVPMAQNNLDVTIQCLISESKGARAFCALWPAFAGLPRLGASRMLNASFCHFLAGEQTIELRREAIENHKMKTRCFDHIDLRVKDMEVARKLYGKFLPQLGFVQESPGEDFHTFYSAGGDKPSEFFGFT